MKQRTTLLALFPALVAFTPAAQRLAFGPESGTILAKTFTVETSMSLDNMDMLVDGNSPPMDMEMEMSSDAVVEFAVTDEYVEVGGGQVLKLARTFEDLTVSNESSMSMSMMGEQNMSSSGESQLTGKTIVFSRDGDTGEVSTAFAEDSEGDDDLLEDLYLEFDFSGLLPTEEVEEGASWEVDPAKMVDVLAPCGDLKIDIEVDGDDMGMSSGPDASTDLRAVLGEIEGSVTATLSGFREDGDRQLAVIKLVVEIESAKDLTEMSREMMSDMGDNLPEGASMEVESFDSELALEGEGELAWDVAGGHFASFSLSVEMGNTIDSANSMNFGGQEMLQEMSMEMGGTMTFSATAERQ